MVATVWICVHLVFAKPHVVTEPSVGTSFFLLNGTFGHR